MEYKNIDEELEQYRDARHKCRNCQLGGWCMCTCPHKENGICQLSDNRLFRLSLEKLLGEEISNRDPKLMFRMLDIIDKYMSDAGSNDAQTAENADTGSQKLFKWHAMVENRCIADGYLIAKDRGDAEERLKFVPFHDAHEVLELDDSAFGDEGLEFDKDGIAIRWMD